MKHKMDYEQVAEIRHRVKAAFGALRKTGFVTRSNFSCCMSCAIAELVEIAEKQRRDRAAYWHHQDEHHFRKGGSLSIRLCWLPLTEIQGDSTLVETQIGEQVAESLRKAGLELDWNGNPATTIRITGVAAQSTTEIEEKAHD